MAVAHVACHCPRAVLESQRLTPPATAWAEGAQLNGRPPRDCVGGGAPA